tara:strand:- start:1056 stop:1463 length:408 start_codon:yes stop_codon:yes gene_type:complete
MRNMSKKKEKLLGGLLISVALKCLGEHRDMIGTSEIAKLVLKAIQATREAIDREVPEKIYCSLEASEVVATAYFIWMMGLEKPNDLITNSTFAVDLLGFAQGMTAMHHINLASGCCDDDDMIFTYGVERFVRERP